MQDLKNTTKSRKEFFLLQTYSSENWEKLGKDQEKFSICECCAYINNITILHGKTHNQSFLRVDLKKNRN